MTYVETLFDIYTDVPKSILIKIELLRLGVRYTRRAKEAAIEGGAAPQTYYLFSHDVTVTPDLELRKEENTPETIILKDGTTVQTRINNESPYLIDLIEDKFILYEKDRPMIEEGLNEVTFLEAPHYYSRNLEDGTPMRKLVSYIPMLFSTLLQHCEYFDMGLECKFCDVTTNVRRQLQAGRRMIIRKDPEKVAEVMEIALKESNFLGRKHYILSGGSIVSDFKGQTEIDYYMGQVSTIIDRIGRRWRGTVQVQATVGEDSRKVADTGIAAVNANIEVWDPELFKLICPGKSKYIGRDEWIRRVVDSVDYFLEGGVNPNFVTGVEMSKPWGFKDVDEAVESTLSGFEYLIIRGVSPRMDMWCIESSSWLGQVPGQEPAPSEYYVKIQRGYHDLMKRYGVYYSVAWDRECCQIDPAFDWKTLYPR